MSGVGLPFHSRLEVLLPALDLALLDDDLLLLLDDRHRDIEGKLATAAPEIGCACPASRWPDASTWICPPVRSGSHPGAPEMSG
jgi:hypothetical protein